MEKPNLLHYMSVALKGAGMGAADVVPGVSGGTIAFITGIYEELIHSIKSVNGKAFKLLFTFQWKAFWQHVNGNFLLAVFAGILFSILSLARGIKYLLDHHPILIWSFFFGLILSSAYFVARRIKRWQWPHVLSLALGAGLAYFITSSTPASTPESYGFVFLSGAIAICAMILPGISGSFILLLLGKYAFILGAISGFQLDIIAIFAVGAAIGLISFANLLDWLLKRFHDITVAVLAGFMLGSLNKVWPWKEVVETTTDRHGEVIPLVERNIGPGTFEIITQQNSQLAAALALFAAGVLLIVAIEWVANRSNKKAANQ